MKVEVVGCGFISGTHMNAWRNSGLKVNTACDLNEESAKQFTKDFNIPSHYTSFPKMLKNEDLFAVSVCGQPRFHVDTSIEALKRGYHVVVEKSFKNLREK